MSADVAGSGGAYGGTSRFFARALGPPIGFMVAWTWIILAFTAIGAPAAFFAQLGVAGWMRSLGVATGASAFTTIGTWVSGRAGSIVVGTVLLLFFTAVLIRGVRVYMKIQNWTFLVPVLGMARQGVLALV